MLANHQKHYLIFKRFLDVIVSLLSLLVLFPFLFLVGLITKLTSKGPVFYLQKRLGIHEKEFEIIKFRSMKQESPYKGAEYLSEEESDQLVTKWGWFLRKTAFDELPQLLNILKGDMSFIGPRPGLTEKGESELIRYRKSYLPTAYEVKPGLSGYSQVYLNRSHDVRLRAKYDSFYVKHICFSLDCHLFFLSILAQIGFKTKPKS